jgi:hypothetical protein
MQAEQAVASAPTAAQPREVKSENKTMENSEKDMFENISELGRTSFSLEGAKKLATLYIESSERLAKQVLDIQAKATEWAKDTPLAAVFEAQNSMGRKLVELSAGTARRLWRI